MPIEDIEHIVVLMLENRSFDHLLGGLSVSGGRGDVDGVLPDMSNPNSFGGTSFVRPVTTEKFLTDPHHGFTEVEGQLRTINGKSNQGFVFSYETTFPTPDKKKRLAPEIMAYQTPAGVPIHFALAQEYAISDRWFSPVPSETWPNRIFANAATTVGRLTNDIHLYNLQTVFSRLRGKGLEWACYNDQIPNMINIRHLAGEWLRSRHRPTSRFRSMDQFEADCAASALRQYSFIEPIYFFGGANDDHPPHDLIKGELLLAQIYLAIRKNETLWRKTMLIVTMDEHGGFFDHVPPPKGPFIPAPKLPSGVKPDFGFEFDQLGPRVPAIVVTPWASQRQLFRPGVDEFYDHTSMIRTAAQRWQFEPLTERDAKAKDLWNVLDLAAPRTDDAATFKQISDWYNFQRPQTLAAVTPVQREMVGADGHAVAARIAAERPKATLATATGERQMSEFQVSMSDLAAAVLAESPALQAEAID
jgi:phospholipase C